MKYTLFWLEYGDEVFGRYDVPESIKIIQYEDKNKLCESEILPNTIATNGEELTGWESIFCELSNYVVPDENNIFIFPSRYYQTNLFKAKKKFKYHLGLSGSGFLNLPEEENNFEKLEELFVEKLNETNGIPDFISLAKPKREPSLVKTPLSTDPNIVFIADSRNHIYHSLDCEDVKNIPENLRICFARKPQKAIFIPCEKCTHKEPELIKQIIKPKISLPKDISRTPKPKSEIIGKQIQLFCEDLGMHAEIIGGKAFITTISGEWYFTYNDRPITLKHKNSEMRFYSDGTRKNNLYHTQPKVFYSPAHAIIYIARHDSPIDILKYELLKEDALAET